MAIGIRARWEPMRELAFGAIGLAFAKVGTPLSHPARQILYQNDTDVEICISLNGSDIHFILSPGKAFVDDISANKAMATDLCQSAGDQIWIKNRGHAVTPASIGTFTVSVKYAKES